MPHSSPLESHHSDIYKNKVWQPTNLHRLRTNILEKYSKFSRNQQANRWGQNSKFSQGATLRRR